MDHQHPVAYESRKLSEAERNYPAHVFELLAVAHSLRAFQHYPAPRPAGPPGCLTLGLGWRVILTCGRTTRRSRGSTRTNP